MADEGSNAAVYGRCAAPKVAMPARGVVLGIAWSGVEGAGHHVACAKIELGPEKPKLTQVWRPFHETPGRRDVQERFAHWLAEEARWAEGRLTVGVDFPLSLAETHLRQLGLLRQALRGPAALGRGLEDRFLLPGKDHTAAAESFREELGKDMPRLTDCYRAASYNPTHARLYRQTFFGLSVMARLSGVSFLPWDQPAAGRPALVEVRPEHVTRVLAGTCTYRDGAREGVQRSSARAAILRSIRSTTGLEFEMELVARAVEDGKGAYMDAVLGAVAAAAAQADGFRGVPANVPRSEGWIHSVREEPWRE